MGGDMVERVIDPNVKRWLFIQDGDGVPMLDIPAVEERTVIFPGDYHHRFHRAAMLTEDAYQQGLLRAICILLDEIMAQKKDADGLAVFIHYFSELVAQKIGDDVTRELFTQAAEASALNDPQKWLAGALVHKDNPGALVGGGAEAFAAAQQHRRLAEQIVTGGGRGSIFRRPKDATQNEHTEGGTQGDLGDREALADEGD